MRPYGLPERGTRPATWRVALLAGPVVAGVLLSACSSRAPAEGPVPLLRAHAHNDYLHERPLYDALDHGFSSVEADIHLVHGELYIGHDFVTEDPERTLRALYLDPLRERIHENGGSVYPDGTQLTLLIDMKTPSAPTYEVLRDVLQDYENILTTFGPDWRQDGPVLVITGGSRDTMALEVVRYAARNGGLEILDSDDPDTLTLLVGARWADVFRWRGDVEMPESQQEKLFNIVEQAHEQGRRVRFCATPDFEGPQREAVWQMLVDADVDLINTDQLDALQAFLLEHDPDLKRGFRLFP